MSNSELELKQNSREVVRLKVDGASTSVNTLRDQQTARGVSLVCPFPALEVDVPVSFASHEDGGLKHGSIHRIGVEDDPETGLPRLRLSIRTRDTRATTVAQPPAELIAESNPTADIPAPDQPDLDDTIEEEELEKPEKLTFAIADGFEDDTSTLFDDSDPAWVDCPEIPLPEEFMERSRTRRRYKLAGRAAWLAVLALVVTGGYILERTGYVDMQKIRSYVSGFSMESIGMVAAVDEAEKPLLLESLDEPSSAIPAQTPQPTATPPTAEDTLEDTSSLSAPPALAEAIPPRNEKIAAPAPDPMVVPASADGPAEGVAEQNSETETQAEAPPAPLNNNEVDLILPTRWPVEYATGYRVRNPNGVVIDVPGGLVKREGWLEKGTEHPMIRSIKSIQRETGARFVIYVHGDLPRFITSPKAGGVSLRLYHENGEASATDKVALLN